MTRTLIEFSCADCGSRVICSTLMNVEDHCASCWWIRKHVPPDQQAAVRDRLGVPLIDRGDPGARRERKP